MTKELLRTSIDIERILCITGSSLTKVRDFSLRSNCSKTCQIMIEVKLYSYISIFSISEYNFNSIISLQVIEKFDLKEKSRTQSGHEIVAETEFALIYKINQTVQSFNVILVITSIALMSDLLASLKASYLTRP